MGKKPKSKPKPSFFKTMLGDFTHQLQIPPRFVLHYNDILPKKLLLKTSCGDFWAVKLKEEKHEMFFGEGWSGFVKDNSLDFGDLLVFKSLGNSKVYVKIYSKDCCEKERILEKSTIDQGCSCKKKAKQGNVGKVLTITEGDQLCDSKDPKFEREYQVDDQKESEDEASLEILGEDWCACKTVASPRNEVFNKGKKSNNLRKLKSNDACLIEKKDNRHVSCIGGSSLNQSRDHSLDKMKKRKVEQGLADRKIMKRDEGNGHGKRSMNSDAEFEVSVSKDVCSTDEKVVSVSKEVDSTNEEDGLTISKGTDSTYEVSKDVNSSDEEVELSVSKDADSTNDKVELFSSKHANSTDKGVQLHGFEQRTSSYHRDDESSPKVTSSKRNPDTLPETGQSTDSTSGFKSKYPSFIVRLGRSYVNTGFLHIPVAFAVKYLPKISTNAFILDSSERTWIVQYVDTKNRTWMGKHLESGRGCFSVGWKELVVANELKVGYVCAFELIDEKNFTLKISVLSKEVIE